MSDPIEAEILDLIADAQHYVVASDPLRPKVLQAAKDVSRRRRRLGSAMLILLTSLAASLVIVWFDDQMESMPVPLGMSAEQVHVEAGLRIRGTSKTFDWAVSEIVAESREVRPSNKVNFGAARTHGR